MRSTVGVLLLVTLFSVVLADEVIIGPEGGPASSYPYCGS